MKVDNRHLQETTALKSLTLRIRDSETQRIIRTAMRETGEVCATRAILSALMAFDRLSEQSKTVLKENSRLRAENAAMKEKLKKITEVLNLPPETLVL